MDDEAQKLIRARRKVEAITGFYIHAAVYVIVNVGLVLIDLATGPDWWVQWVVAGWGIGVIAHAAVVYGVSHPRVAAWEERKVRELAGAGRMVAAAAQPAHELPSRSPPSPSP